ncbi:MAG: hypothetical protein QNJ31_06845 [Candidatus Caenarcaniphilales bacterium]|nr:hypothetical protein [Candidatus Caenarcaniphilales bacterium]
MFPPREEAMPPRAAIRLLDSGAFEINSLVPGMTAAICSKSEFSSLSFASLSINPNPPFACS